MSEVRGYKVFDHNWTCKGFQYKVGETFEENIKPKVCVQGFHFCKELSDCFNYYGFDPENKVAEIIALGKINTDGRKSCTNKIQIVRELSWHEVLDLINSGKNNTGRGNSGNCNSGDYNSGNYNSGYCNSGNCNSGRYNSGNCNSGDYNNGIRNSGERNSGDHNSGGCNSGSFNSGIYNSGNCNSGYCNNGNCNSGSHNSGERNSGNFNSGIYNSGDFNSGNYTNGCFCTKSDTKIPFFNRPSNFTYEDWRKSHTRFVLCCMPFACDYIGYNDMSETEKAEHPEAEITGGYLKQFTAEDRQNWWDALSEDDKAAVKSLPNFDADIFKEITDIDIRCNH